MNKYIYKYDYTDSDYKTIKQNTNDIRNLSNMYATSIAAQFNVYFGFWGENTIKKIVFNLIYIFGFFLLYIFSAKMTRVTTKMYFTMMRWCWWDKNIAVRYKNSNPIPTNPIRQSNHISIKRITHIKECAHLTHTTTVKMVKNIPRKTNISIIKF